MHGLELAQHYFPIAIMGFGALAFLVCALGIGTQLSNLKLSRSRRRDMASVS